MRAVVFGSVLAVFAAMLLALSQKPPTQTVVRFGSRLHNLPAQAIAEVSTKDKIDTTNDLVDTAPARPLILQQPAPSMDASTDVVSNPEPEPRDRSSIQGGTHEPHPPPNNSTLTAQTDAPFNDAREAPTDAKPGDDIWRDVKGPIVGGTISAFVSFVIFVVLASRKERRDRAMVLLQEFATSEHYVRVRLVSQQYLIPNGTRFNLSLDKDGHFLNLVELTTALEGPLTPDTPGQSTNPLLPHNDGTGLDRQNARFDIRALASFFWTVDRAHAVGYIKAKRWWIPRSRDEKLFCAHYAWYWVHIFQFRLQGCSDHRLFRKIDWLIDDEEIRLCEDELKATLRAMPADRKAAWNRAVNALASSSKTPSVFLAFTAH